MTAPTDPLLVPFRLGPHQLPGVWRFGLPEELQWLKLPAERHATCADCYQVQVGEYRDDCRCCTYFPELSNFSLGLALGDNNSRAAVLRLVRERFVLPFGLLPTPLRYRGVVAAYANDRFGEEPEMLCPFVEPSTFDCLVYPFRNSVCSTFFCVNDHGGDGSRFWLHLQTLVGQVDTAIAQWCMDELGLPHEGFVARLDELSSDIPSLSVTGTLAWSELAYATLWDDWCGREVEFLEACGRLVSDHRDELYALACQQADRNALVYEEQVRQFIPVEHHHALPPAAVENRPTRPIEDCWYKVQLAARQLWELPFHGAPVQLSDAVELVPNPRDDEWLRGAPEGTLVRSVDAKAEPQISGLLGPRQVALLRLFQRPQLFDEALFSQPEVLSLDDARDFLAQCLRLGILTEIRPT